MHTPGNWKYAPPERDDYAPKYARFIIRGNGENDPSGDWEIAYVINGPELLDGTDCVEGNARLIAAAPALLAACKEMVAMTLAQASLGLSKGEREMVDNARAAIALAENSAD